MKKLFLLIIFFYLFYLISSQNCNPRTNCRRRNGRCINDICECNYGFATFLKPNSKEIIYCNYEQIDNWVPFILEIFLPSTGHFYVGNFILGFSKFGLLLIPFITLSIGLCFIIPISEAPLDLNENLHKQSIFLYIPILIGNIFYFIIASLYIIDPLCYLFGFYKDGNGVPLI